MSQQSLEEFAIYLEQLQHELWEALAPMVNARNGDENPTAGQICLAAGETYARLVIFLEDLDDSIEVMKRKSSYDNAA